MKSSVQKQRIGLDIKSLLVKNTFWIYLLNYLGAPFGYAIRIFYTRTLTVEEYAIFYAVLGFFSLISLLSDLGLSETLNYYGVRFFERNDWKSLKTTILFTFFFQVCSSFILTLILYSSASFLSQNYFHTPEAASLLRGLLVYFIFLNLLKPILSVFKIKQKLFKSTFISTLRLPLIFTFSLPLLFVHTLKVVVLSWSLTYILLFIIGFILALKEFPALRQVRFKQNLVLYKKLLSYASIIILSSGATLLLNRIDVQLITYFRSLHEVALYVNALSLAQLFTKLIVPFTIIIFPLTTKLFEKGRLEELKYILSHILQGLLFFGLPFLLTFLLYPQELLLLFYGKLYVAGDEALVILIVGSFFAALTGVNFAILAGTGAVKRRLYITYLAAMINLVGDLLLIPRLGIRGAAIMTSMSYLLMFVFSYNKILPLPSLNYGLKLFLANTLFLTIVILLKNILSCNYYLEALIILFFSSSAYLLFGWKAKIFNFQLVHYFIQELKR